MVEAETSNMDQEKNNVTNREKGRLDESGCFRFLLSAKCAENSLTALRPKKRKRFVCFARKTYLRRRKKCGAQNNVMESLAVHVCRKENAESVVLRSLLGGARSTRAVEYTL